MKKRGFFGVSWVEFSDRFEKKKKKVLRTGRRDWPTALQIDYVKTLGRREIKREQNEDVGKPKSPKRFKFAWDKHQTDPRYSQQKIASFPVDTLITGSLVINYIRKAIRHPYAKNCSTTFTILNYHFYFFFLLLLFGYVVAEGPPDY